MKTWVIGYDFSHCSDHALEFAAAELGLNSGRLVLVHAYHRPHKQVGFELAQLTSAIKPLDDAEDILRDVIGRRLESVATEVARKHPTLDVVVRLVEGPAATRVVQVATEMDADIIVMGTHGHRGLKRLFLGSVTQQLLTQARCPVLVVRAQDNPDVTETDAG